MSDIAIRTQEEEHIEPERILREGTFTNGVRVFELRGEMRHKLKRADPITFSSDWYVRCPRCGWYDHRPTLPQARRLAYEHQCEPQP